MIIHPNFDPVAVEVFGFSIRWYGILYLIGLGLAWAIAHQLLKKASFSSLRGLALEDLIVAAAIGVIIGGRLGYVLFYNPAHYFANPLEVFYLWRGGMSFHGGLLGVIGSLWVLAYLHAIPDVREALQAERDDESSGDAGDVGDDADDEMIASMTSQKSIFLRLVDLAAVLTPPGLGLGRLGNFINGELPGRVTSPDLPWAMSFGIPDYLPRHPSQLYQLFLEGFVLAAVMLYLARMPRAPGWLAGVFLVGYSVGRFFVEFFREPDGHIGLLFLDLSMGQLLSIPMFLLGVFMMQRLKLVAWWQAASLASAGGAVGGVGGSIKEFFHRTFAAEPDSSWSEHERSFAENYGDDEEVEGSSRLGAFFSSLFGGGDDDEEEYVYTRVRLTRQEKRRLKKKKRKKR